jgi:hypothetical protein
MQFRQYLEEQGLHTELRRLDQLGPERAAELLDEWDRQTLFGGNPFHSRPSPHLKEALKPFDEPPIPPAFKDPDTP